MIPLLPSWKLLKRRKKISEVVLADQAADMGLSEEEVFAKMDHDVDVMIEAVQFGKRKDQKSTSGLTGGEGYKWMYTARKPRAAFPAIL